ncbi:hypothetical protein SBE55_10330 [Mycolicibacterium sp. 141076]|uniref:zinc finger domain-containing protein n=1 Tax=Mycolicibacterium sp. 141076 TaxID=3090599 RepID=UPI00299E0EBF|nr:hypothetical protein [Mycolicibacterium sp. 141076]MDX1878214.1 hypothetical protein [Mycolicibacterium sp. 141076]
MSYPTSEEIRTEALKRRCPFCGAKPGQRCRVRITSSGGERDWPHARRIAACRPPKPALDPVQALCCECGQLRTVSAGYYTSYKDPNSSAGGFEDKRGWRRTCTLKCAQCGKSTRHALVHKHEASDQGDWCERTQRFVLGGESPNEYWDEDYRKKLRTEYFAQFPRNPQLKHRYYVSEAKEAFAAGQKTITSLCGAPMDLDFDPNLSTKAEPNNQLVKPDRIDWETEFEDRDTGMWWVDMQCVDCLSVSNRIRIKHQRQEVLAKLLEASAAIEALGAQDLAALSKHLDALIGGDQ